MVVNGRVFVAIAARQIGMPNVHALVATENELDEPETMLTDGCKCGFGTVVVLVIY